MRIATVTGILLIIASAIGTLFFRHYHGTVIPYPALWSILFAVAGPAGFWLIYTSVSKKENKYNQELLAEKQNFIAKAEKIKLDVDKCQFKSGYYTKEVEDPNVASVNIFLPYKFSHMKPTVTETVVQSFFTYTDTIGGKTYKYISPSFQFDKTTLEFYVMNNNIVLYLDRFDKSKFFFDLNK